MLCNIQPQNHATINIYFSEFWNLGSPKLRCQSIWFLRELASWFADSHLLLISSADGERGLISSLLFIKALIHHWSPTLMISPKPDYFLKAPFQILSHCRLGIQHLNLGGRGKLWSMVLFGNGQTWAQVVDRPLILLFIYLFILAALHLRCCALALSSFGVRASPCSGVSSRGASALRHSGFRSCC